MNKERFRELVEAGEKRDLSPDEYHEIYALADEIAEDIWQRMKGRIFRFHELLSAMGDALANQQWELLDSLAWQFADVAREQHSQWRILLSYRGGNGIPLCEYLFRAPEQVRLRAGPAKGV